MLYLPLRYPGGKTQLVSYISLFLESNGLEGCQLIEPYAGGAAVSLNMLDMGLVSKIIINEKDPLLYCFWKAVFFYTKDLCKMISETKVTIDKWHEMKLYRSIRNYEFCDIVEAGFACLFLNRTSFSGLLKSNPLGGLEQKSKYKIDCRFNKEKIIESIHHISQYRENVSIHNYDAIYFMHEKIKYCKNNYKFIYIDPPYYKQGKSLYRYYYKEEDHAALASFILRKSIPWLISYDDTDYIKNLYTYPVSDGMQISVQKTYFDYSAHTSKMMQSEILISNRRLPPTRDDKIVAVAEND